MTPDTGSLTAVLREFLAVFKLGQVAVSHDASSLLSIIAAIELTLAGLMWALTGSDAISGLFRKILVISFFVFVIDRYDWLLRTVIQGFIHVGKTASSASTDVFTSFQDPSSIVDIGFHATAPIVDHLRNISYFPPPLFDILFSLFSLLCILAAFFVIAIQVFITYLEFAMISTLALIFVPFGAFRHTSFLTEKTFGAVISFGVKLMVLGLIVSVVTPLLRTLELPADPSFAELVQMLIICLSVAALSWHAPGLAAGLLAGGPSLSAVHAAQAAAAGGVAAAALAGGAAVGGREVFRAASFGLGQFSSEKSSKSGTRGSSEEGNAAQNETSQASARSSSGRGFGPAGTATAGSKPKPSSSSGAAEGGRENGGINKESSSSGSSGSTHTRTETFTRAETNQRMSSGSETSKGGALSRDNIVRFEKKSGNPLKASTVYETLTPEEARPAAGAHVPIRESEES